MYLTHLVLSKTVENAPLYARLADNPYAEHQALWELFPGFAQGRKQPFLFRTNHTPSGLEVYLLSDAPPTDTGPWVARSREFRPALSKGQVLSFRLRFSPVVDKAQGAGKRSVRVNAVMDAYRKDGARRQLREVASDVAKTWLDARAAAAGAKFLHVYVEGYEGAVISRKQEAFNVPLLDVSGELEVADPTAFLARVALGWGRSQYAGAGLMLLARPKR